MASSPNPEISSALMFSTLTCNPCSMLDSNSEEDSVQHRWQKESPSLLGFKLQMNSPLAKSMATITYCT
jgi:hypothetical protein